MTLKAVLEKPVGMTIGADDPHGTERVSHLTVTLLKERKNSPQSNPPIATIAACNSPQRKRKTDF